MLTDITLPLTSSIVNDTPEHANKALIGHIGTHFDVMNTDFPLRFTKRDGIIFDVSAVKGRDIDITDADTDKITDGMFVAFYTGYIETIRYGSPSYFKEHPQLSFDLIDRLLEKGVSIIGIDCPGIRRGKEHTPADQRCADRGAFVVENLCNLKAVLEHGDTFTAHTYPMSYVGITGLPCRVIAEQ